MKIYLAGPDVFLSDAVEHGKKLVSYCKENGLEGLFPLDNEVTVPFNCSNPKSFLRQEIKKGNCNMMKMADAIVANITPFRGSGADNGTTYEIGFMEALGKPVFLYTTENSIKDYRQKVIISDGLSFDSLVDKKGLIIEDFGLSDNLMFADSPVYIGFEKAIEAVLCYMKEREDFYKSEEYPKFQRSY